MLNKMLDEPVPVLTDCSIGTLDGQDVAAVLQFARSPEDLHAGITSELVLSMTPQQARELGAGLLALAQTATLGPVAANDANIPEGFSQRQDGSLDKPH